MNTALGEKPMITRRPAASQPAWKRELGRAITDPEVLLDMLALDRSLLPAARRAAELFGLRVPRGFVARMRPGDPRDPLLRQVLPLADELVEAPGFTADPVGDRAAEIARGVLKKYAGRVLLVASGACAVNCRYCFRREYPYRGHLAATGEWADAIAAVASDPTVTEVILSGGDPLTLADDQLARLTEDLFPVQHVARFRIHTRMPVVLPERVDAEFCLWLESLPWPVTVVLHANHPREIDESVDLACRRMRAAGATLLNQSVLLKGVNDDADVLLALSEFLFSAGVLPYYVHMLDPVTGAAHFHVTEQRARQLMDTLGARLPGYLLPRLVREIAGAPSKTLVLSATENVTPEAVPPPSPM